MKKTGRTILTVLALCLGMTALAGCKGAGSFDPKTDSLYISKKGEISSGFVVEVDQTYYSKDEMLAFCEEEVKAYNVSQGASNVAYEKDAAKNEVLPVAIEKLSYGSQAVLILNYAKGEDYVAFNEKDEDAAKTLMFAAAKNTTGLPDVEFISVEDGSKIPSSAVLGDSKLKIVMIQGQIPVQVQGEIVYISKNVTVKASDQAITGAEGYSYILFK